MIPNWSWNWENWQNSDLSDFGSADGPRVRGGQSAVHGTCSPEALQRSSQPQKYTADGPPKDRGRSAHVGQILPEAVLFGLQCKKFQRRTVRRDIADSPRLDRKVGSARLDLYWMSLSHPSTKPHTNIKKVSLFLSQARGGDDKVKPFWSGSRTVRAHPRTLLKIVHHVLSVFR